MAGLIPIRPLLAIAAAVSLVAAAPPAPASHAAVSIDYFDCISLGHGRFECDYSVSGGTAPYTYSWSPPPSWGGGDGGTAIVPCVAYRTETVTLTVTDADGSSDTASGTFYCGDAV